MNSGNNRGNNSQGGFCGPYREEDLTPSVPPPHPPQSSFLHSNNDGVFAFEEGIPAPSFEESMRADPELAASAATAPFRFTNSNMAEDDDDSVVIPEPEFDPEAVLNPIRKPCGGHRNKIVAGGLLVGLAVIMGLAIGIPATNNSKNRQEINSAHSGSSSSTDLSPDSKNGPLQDFDNQDIDTVMHDGKRVGGNGGVFSPTTTVSNGAIDTTKNNLGGYIDPKLGFDVSLAEFSEDVLRGYSSCVNLLRDVEEAGKYLANTVISNSFLGQDMVVMSAGADASGGGPDSYQTNNQEEGVDEADIVKSDGKLVYAAYGNEILVLDIQGNILQRLQIPQVDYPFPVAKFWNPEEATVPTGFASAASMSSGYYAPSQQIKSLLLEEGSGRLAAIVGGFQYSSSLHFLSGGVTSIFIYDIAQDPQVNQEVLSLVDSKTIRGAYRDARLIGNTAHVVTMAEIGSYTFSSYLKRWMFHDVSDQDYPVKAYERAEILVPQFARQLLAELLGNAKDGGSLGEGDCRRIVGISSMQTGEGKSGQDLTGNSGILNGFVQTTSFDVTEDTQLGSRPAVSGAFLPTPYMDMYASKDTLVVAGRGWKWVGDFDAKEYTYLLGFDTSSGRAAVPSAVGVVQGYLQDQFALDEHDGYLRVATTTTTKWGQLPETGEWGQIIPSSSQINVLQRQGNQYEVVGSVTDLAKGEEIYSVRFLDDKAFVVTFQRIDPFFTFDMSDPTDPRLVGELKIPGYSNYLHPMEDPNFVLAVGQDADETGRPKGLQVSVFDVTDFANPSRVQHIVVEGGSSHSEAQFDHHAFRYVPETKSLIIPVSKYTYRDPMAPEAEGGEDGDNFDGFHVYRVDPREGIFLQGQVTHADAGLMDRNCFSWSYIPARSMVFGGNLMTLKGHSVLMTEGMGIQNELSKGEDGPTWMLDLDASRTEMDEAGCMPWFV